MKSAVQYPIPSADIPVHPPLVHMPPRWEYKYLVRDRFHEGALGEEELNELGREGWELVGVFSDACAVNYCFKRGQ